MVCDDGRDYIDMCCALGAISLGYAETQADPIYEIGEGWIYSLPSIYEDHAAERVAALAPWATAWKPLKTGSEATHGAYRVAKAATGRQYVMVGDWAYHGWHEWCSFNGDELATVSRTAARFPHGADMDDASQNYGAYWARTHEPPAAVFIEPHRWEPIDVAWLQHVREYCDRVGALLVFDEMIYGGRWALGGASEYYSVTPDLACYGKAIGNGAPIAVLVGGQALVDYGEAVSGTYSGDAAALAALSATVDRYLDEPIIDTLWARGRQLAAGIDDVLARYTNVRREGAPVHQRIVFDGDETAGQRLAVAMARRGVLYHPQVINVSAAHTEFDIDAVVGALRESCAELFA